MLQEVAAKRGAPSSVNLSAIHANLRSRSALANICAYKDTSGLFTEETVSTGGTTLSIYRVYLVTMFG